MAGWTGFKFYKFAFKSIMYKLYNNPLYLYQYFKKIYFLYVYDFEKLKEIYSKYKYLTLDQTLDKILVEKKSLVRFGDGEIEMILGCSNYSPRYKEKYSKKLAKLLKEALLDTDNKNLLISLPYKFFFKNHKNSLYWYFAQYNYYKYLKKNYHYGDAFIFRSLSEKNYSKLYSYVSKKNIIYISHKENIKKFKGLNFKKIEYVEVPAHESFSQYDLLKENVLKLLKGKNYSNSIILISAGKTSKVLAYELCDKVQVLDFGAFFEGVKYDDKKESKDCVY